MMFFISVDMEGISGLVDWDDPQEKISKFMTSDVNAVLKGIFTKDPNAEILICDAHSSGNNLNIMDLPRNIQLIQGRTRPYYMVEGYDSSFHAAFLIGYHAPVGTYKGLMDHSYSSSSFYEVKINGLVVGESEINAILLSEESIPVILISGDDQLKNFSQSHFPDTSFVISKHSIGKFSASLIHPELVHRDLEQKTIAAIDKISSTRCFAPLKPYLVEIALVNTLQADFAGILPGVERKDGRNLSFSAKDGKEMYRFMMSILYLCIASKK